MIRGFLADVQTELEAFDALFAIENRLSVFHLQQAAEKLVRAVRVHRGLLTTKEHRLGILVDGTPASKEPRPLPQGDPWRPRLLELDWLSAYATAYRYPTARGRLGDPPEAPQLRTAREQLMWLLGLARSELLGPAD